MMTTGQGHHPKTIELSPAPRQFFIGVPLAGVPCVARAKLGARLEGLPGGGSVTLDTLPVSAKPDTSRPWASRLAFMAPVSLASMPMSLVTCWEDTVRPRGREEAGDVGVSRVRRSG